ncbi:MAG: riboflavin synthase [Kiritimatiellae bacterium]|nr:riboflavin synthase [Kiritimatiellia bacterium]MDW8458969.1 riboflavin synthase [Verrucomicrobiota bacterium]
MFTGIVQRTGEIETLERSGGHGRLRVRAGEWEPSISIGESVAVEGICLTVTEARFGVLSFDVLKETFDRTNLGEKKIGSRVNLERALRAGDPIGGHFVTGHVDGVGRVRKLTPIGRDWILEIGCDPELMMQMVGKGSIAVSGVSLTLVDLFDDGFTVHLIPHTWANTSLSELRPGDAVNLETDMIGKYVQRFVRLRTS